MLTRRPLFSPPAPLKTASNTHLASVCVAFPRSSDLFQLLETISKISEGDGAAPRSMVTPGPSPDTGLITKEDGRMETHPTAGETGIPEGGGSYFPPTGPLQIPSWFNRELKVLFAVRINYLGVLCFHPRL